MSKQDELPKKLRDKVPQPLLDGIETMSEAEIKERIVKAEALLVDTEKEMKDSATITALKEQLKDINGAYKDTKNAANASIKFCVWHLRKRGLSLK